MDALADLLRDLVAEGIQISGVAAGDDPLLADHFGVHPPAAGILDGKTVTTHWRYSQRLGERYPKVSVQPNALYVDQGQVVTSAGSAAGLDMLVHLVRRDYGPKVANQVAQRLVIPPHRDGDQAQYVPRPVVEEDAGRLARLLDWLRAHLDSQHSIASLSKRASMSPRTLLRRFKSATGETPLHYLQQVRIEAAKPMLEEDRMSVQEVGLAVGYEDVAFFRDLFKRHTGVPPGAYRDRFGRGMVEAA